MFQKQISIAIALLIISVFLYSGLARAQSRGVSPKIETNVLSDLRRDRTVTFFVVLREQADVRHAAAISDWKDRGEAVVNSLKDTAGRTQAPLLDFLTRFNAEVTLFWIINTIKVTTSDEQVIHRLAALPSVASIIADKTWQVPEPAPGAQEPTIQSIEWGVALISAPGVWAQFGARGQGIVVANIDTGVQFDHPALILQYRGRRIDGTFDHNYNWHDPSHICGNPSLVPCDNSGHGTHTMGTMVGDDGGANQIGVAPAAKWITAKGCDTNNCSSSALLSSGQWILAPTDLNGQNPRPDLRPNIVNNSWGNTGNDPFYQPTVQAWVNAGIFPAFSIGNSGPACSTTSVPGAYPESFGVGAVDIFDNVASFSGRGPTGGIGGIVKPNVSAPGVSVRSSIPTNNYANFSGTSMAAPHVSGVVALLWSANPALIGNVTATEDLLQQTADFRPSTQCGTAGPPNNVYGWGIVNALSAVQAALPTVTIAATSPTAIEGGTPGEFTVTRTGNTSSTLTVNYTVGGSASPGSDYTSLSGNVLIPAGQSSVAIPLNAINDSVTDPNETVIVTLSANAMYTLGSPNSVTVTIIDSDSNTPTWPAAPNNLVAQCSANNTQATLSWSSVNGATGYAVRVNSKANDGPGCLNGWYCSDPPDKIVNNYGTTSYVASVTPGQAYDFWVHGLQGNNYGNAGVASFTCSTTLPTLTISATTPTAVEGGASGAFTVTRSGNTSSALTVNYTVSGSATPGNDYTTLSGSVTIQAAQTSSTITVTPIDDSVVEGNETVIVTLSANAAYAVGSPNIATVTIVDNDSTPTWPAAPNNLVAQCSADGLQATLSWNSVNGATGYAVRVNSKANDGPGCLGGWYCSDPPDKIVNNYGSTSYVASVTPGQAYDFWVHGLQGNSYGDAGVAGFNCGAAFFDYTLSNNGNITIPQGASGSNTITGTLVSGTSQAVTLSASGLPSGATAAFTNNPCNPTCSSTLTISTSASTSTGTFSITVTGSAPSKTTGFNLVVNPNSGTPTWPAAPNNLVAQCSADGSQATLSWNSVNGATGYAVRVNSKANDGPGCLDGWYCSDPPDKIVNNYGSTSYVASVTPGQAYDFWVHGLQGNNYGNAGVAGFNCGAPAP